MLGLVDKRYAEAHTIVLMLNKTLAFVGGMILAAIIAGLGLMHVVHTPQGMRLCPKESFAIVGTFVDEADFVGRSRYELIDRLPTIRALERCKLLAVD